MKYFSLYVLVFFIACSNNKSADETQLPNSSSTENKKEQTASSSSGEGIVGEWELVGYIVDTNDNLQLDEDERKNLKSTMKDYMKLNSDGSGLFTVARMEGRYELQAQENSEKKYLT